MIAGLLAGCAGPIAEDNIVRGPGKVVGLSTTAGDPKDFVKEKRLGDEQYIPVGITPTKRAIVPKTPAELAAYEKKLDGDRQKAAGFATRPAPPMKPINQPRTLPPVAGSKIDPTNSDNQSGDADAGSVPVPPGLRPHLVPNP